MEAVEKETKGKCLELKEVVASFSEAKDTKLMSGVEKIAKTTPYQTE